MSKTIRTSLSTIIGHPHNRAAEHREAARIILEGREGLILGIAEGSIEIARDGESRTEFWTDREMMLGRVEGLLGDNGAEVVSGLRFALAWKAA